MKSLAAIVLFILAVLMLSTIELHGLHHQVTVEWTWDGVHHVVELGAHR